MKIIAITTACLMLVWFPADAQISSAVPENVRAAYSIDRFGDGILNEMIFGIPLPAPKMIGDTYIDEEWKKGKVLIYGQEKSIDGYSIRYDLEKKELEVQTKEGVKVIGGRQVKSFITIDPDEIEPSLFLNSREFKTASGVLFEGFLKILHDGPYALVSGYTIKVKRPDYNEAMNVGSRDYKIYKRETLFYIHDGVLAEFPAKKKDLVSIFPGDDQQRVARFIEEKRLNPAEKGDLLTIFQWYNQSLSE